MELKKPPRHLLYIEKARNQTNVHASRQNGKMLFSVPVFQLVSLRIRVLTFILSKGQGRANYRAYPTNPSFLRGTTHYKTASPPFTLDFPFRTSACGLAQVSSNYIGEVEICLFVCKGFQGCIKTAVDLALGLKSETCCAVQPPTLLSAHKVEGEILSPTCCLCRLVGQPDHVH